MTPQEQDLITTLLARLKNAAGQPKDPEADTLIRQAAAVQPDAAYYLVQTVLIQDLSLHTAQNRIAELETQLSDAQQQAARPAPTSFLGSLFGSRQPAPPPIQPPIQPQGTGSVPAAGPWMRSSQVAAAPPAQPWGQPAAPRGYPQPAGPGGGFMGGAMGGGGGGGFLRSAAATAAGVAGGALLFQGIESLFGQHASAGILGERGMTPGLGETVVNNYYGDAGGGDAGGAGQGQDFSGGDYGSGNQDSSGGQDSSGAQDFSGGDGSGDQDFSADQDVSADQDFGSDQDFSGGDFGGNDNPC
ncbi:MAG: DUF2076 domain-containing protein [Stellaceae bacterium]